jgi:hypothetical protein
MWWITDHREIKKNGGTEIKYSGASLMGMLDAAFGKA